MLPLENEPEKPNDKRQIGTLGPWYFGIAHHSTRLADLSIDIPECDVLMRMAIRGLAEWSIMGRYDIAQTKVETYNYNPVIFVIRMYGVGETKKCINRIAETGEVGFHFLDHNPAAVDTLRSICEWWLCLSAIEEVNPSVPGRKVIWRHDGFIIVKYISPFEDFEKAQIM
jgi:hypothetical protein